MGSLTSRPKVKAQPQVVYMPAPAPAYVPPPVPASPADPSDAENAAQARAASLLLRDRGRFGTVLTGFRGLLAPVENFGSRKTLLGE